MHVAPGWPLTAWIKEKSGEPASLTAYLVSRRNGYVTGATVNADGGSDF